MATPTPPPPPSKVRVFVDYWNLQLSLNELEAQRLGVPLGLTAVCQARSLNRRSKAPTTPSTSSNAGTLPKNIAPLMA